jgi:hypothetical protein
MKNLKAFVRKPCGSRAADHSNSRKLSSKIQGFALFAILAVVAVTPLLNGCGGGTAITLAIAPSTAQTLDQGQSVTFFAQLGNDTSNKGVAWQPLTGTGCAGTGCGTLTNVTTTSVTYTAPSGLTSAISVSLEAISNASAGVTKTVTISVVLPPTFPTTVTTQLVNGANGVPYNQTITATNGVAPLTYKITPGSGSLPAGLQMNTTGSIIGTPTGPITGQPNPATFTVTVTDNATTPFSVISPPYTLLINPAPILSLTATTLPNGTVNATYGAAITTKGGVTPFSWSLVSGALPPGLTLNQTSGQITGVPTQAGTYTFTPQVVDSSIPAQTVKTSGPLTITINTAAKLQATTPPLPTGFVGTSYTGNLVATGGIPPYTWSVTTGQLPSGLTLDPQTGVISGSPLLITSSTFVAQVQDSESTPVTASQSLTVSIQNGTTTTNALFTGSYSFLFQGFDAGGNVVIAGNFTSNGSGTISNGTLDSNRASGLFTASTLSGSYSMGADGRGTMTLLATNNKGAELQTTYLLVMDSNRNVRFIENDTSGTHGSGVMKPVVGASLSPSNFSGNYAFQLTGQDYLNKPMVLTGVIRADGASLLSPGTVDVNEGGTYSAALALSGNFSVSTTNEKGVLDFTYNLPNQAQIQQTYTFYFVSPNDIFLMDADTVNVNPPRIGGELVLQNPAQSFDDTSLNGSSVVTMSGLDTNASVIAGVLGGNSTNGIVSVSYDQNDSGTVTTGNVASGTFVADPSKNGHITFTGLGGRLAAAYLTSANQGFVIGSDAAVSYGLLDAQTVQATYSNSSLQGGYTLSAGRTPDTAVTNVVGQINSPGLGLISGTIDEVDNNGTAHSGQTLNATYAFTAGGSGRGTMTTNAPFGLPVNVIFYMVSPSSIRAISADPAGMSGHPEVLYFNH